MTAPVTSQKIERLSFSRFEALRRCPLSVAFAQHGAGVERRSSQSAQLGAWVHDAFEAVIRSGAILGSVPRSAFEAEWHRILDEAVINGEDPWEWPDQRRSLKRALLRLPALASFLAAHGSVDDVTCEEELTTTDRAVYGIVDVIGRWPAGTVLLDLKTGPGSQGGAPKEAYERQLTLYAAIELERSGQLPTKAAILSTVNNWTDIALSSAKCESMLAAARDARDRFNANAPGPQPAEPSASACAYCPYAPRCDAYWSALRPDWVRAASGVTYHAVRGTLSRDPLVAAMGAVTLHVVPTDSTLLGGAEVVVTGLNGSVFLQLAGLEVGSIVGLIGLRPSDIESQKPVLAATNTTVLGISPR